MLNDADYRALQEQAHLMDELTRHPGWAELVALMHEWMNAPKKRLLNGDIKTIDEYQRLTGELFGTHKVLDFPAVVQARLDEEQKQRVERDEPLT